MENSKVANVYVGMKALGVCKKIHVNRAGLLLAVDPPPDQPLPLTRIITGLPRLGAHFGSPLSVIGNMDDMIAITEGYRWANGRELVDSSTRQLRLIHNKSNSIQHKSIEKWERFTTWKPDPISMWGKIWVNFLPERVTCYAWQVMYRATATNAWSFQQIWGPDVKKKCERCYVCDFEDINHCL